MSAYGGIISISIFPGLEKYEVPSEPRNIGLISIATFNGDAKKSYVVSRVDNPDLVEKDIRILDASGKPSRVGRVEVRIDGIWGTICGKGNNMESAIRICKDLGYRTGKWQTPKNEDEASKFCKYFNHDDHCGAITYRPYFSHISCAANDQSFNTCNKKIADAQNCGREFDAIIKCANDNYETDETIPQGTVKLEKARYSLDSQTGRLEYFSRQTFNPLCDLGFNDHAAEVACRQMGFIGGRKYNPSATERFRRESTDSTRIENVEIRCGGAESSLVYCEKRTKNEDCEQDQAVVVTCFGTGDSTGRSQYQTKLKTPDPGLGKLGMMKVRVSCDTLGTDSKFRGDAGSVYLITCPKDCSKQRGNIWGSAIYTINSNICLAAAHSGVINDNVGGTFGFIKLWGNKYYKKETKYGITSTGWSAKWPVSFSVSEINSGWLGMAQIYSANMGGNYLEKDATIILKTESKLPSNEKSTNSIIKNERNNHSHMFTSFMETRGMVLPKAVFEWIQPNPNFKFNDSPGNSVIVKTHSLDTLNRFSIIFKFTMTDFKNRRSYFFSYSGCGGFNVFLDAKDNLIFGDPCSSVNQRNTNIIVPLNDNSIVYAYKEGDNFEIVLFSTKTLTPVTKSFKFNYNIAKASDIGIGRLGTNPDDFFYGSIDFVLIFDEKIPFIALNALLDNIRNRPKITVSRDSSMTDDDRNCIGGCIEGPTPGMPGSPKPPFDSDPNNLAEGVSLSMSMSSSSGGYNPNASLGGISGNGGAAMGSSSGAAPGADCTDDVSSQYYKSSTSSSDSYSSSSSYSSTSSYSESQIGTSIQGSTEISQLGSNYIGQIVAKGAFQSSAQKPLDSVYDVRVVDPLESMEIECDTTLAEKRFTGSIGKTFKVKCPNCMFANNPVYGSGTYHSYSSICRAGLHAGALTKDGPGYLRIKLVQGFEQYNWSPGSFGIKSSNFGAGQISFLVEKADPPKDATCDDTAQSPKFVNEPPGTKLVVRCPENCSKANGNVFGTEVYADMSSICIAAIHYGSINDQGGEVEFIIEGSQNNFPGSKSLGIISKTYGSYIRSFRFIGQKAAIFFNYKEDHFGKVEGNWKIMAWDKALNPASNGWFFEEIRSEIQPGKFQQLKTIHHVGAIRSTISGTYGSWIYLMNAQWANGRIRANFMFNSRKQAALLFRYVDKDNYYAIEFNLDDTSKNFKLIKRVNSVSSVVDSRFIPFIQGKWYRVSILANNEKIEVLMQSDTTRENKPIFNKIMTELARGTAAIGSNDDSNFYVSGFEVDSQMPSLRAEMLKNTKRTYQGLLKKLTDKYIKRYCRERYGASKQATRCQVPMVLCRNVCDEAFSPIENIYNYACFRSCVRKVTEGPVYLSSLNHAVYVPKIHDMFSYKLPDSGEMVPVTIESIKDAPGSGKTLMAQYEDMDGNVVPYQVKWPSPGLERIPSN